jgi:hypothetical protein
MKRICRAAAVVAAVLFVTANASAAPQVSATGSGVAASVNGQLTFVFDAAGIGPDATGTMRFQGLGDTITARVVCLAAGMTHTEIEGQIDTSTVAPGRSGSVGSFMTFDVTPGGSGAGTFAARFGGGDAKAGTLSAFDNELDAQTGKTISATDAALLKQLAAAL